MRWLPYPPCHTYEVSSLGAVRHAISGRLLLGARDRDGYRRVNFRINGRHLGASVHGMVMLAFVGPRPAGQCIDHINRDRWDNRLVNLRYLPTSENSAQGGVCLRGRKKSCQMRRLLSAANTGERHPNARLTVAQAAAIKQRRAAGERSDALAIEYGVARVTVRAIAAGRLWSRAIREAAATIVGESL